MRTYLLPAPDAAERALSRAISGDASMSALWKTFPCGEDNVRVDRPERQVCVIGRTAPPGDNFFRTLLLVDTLRRSGAELITVLLPYFGYARQDRQQLAGEAVTAGAILKALASAGATRIVTADLHSDASRESSPIRLESVSVVADMAAAVRGAIGDEACTVLAPDHGAKHRADLLAAGLGQRQEAAWVEKTRHPLTGKLTATEIRGALRGSTAVIIDDILDSGKTIELAARLLRRRGTTTLYLCITHGLFTGDAVARVRRLKFKGIFVADAVPLPKKAARLPRLRLVPIGPRLAAAVNKE